MNIIEIDAWRLTPTDAQKKYHAKTGRYLPLSERFNEGKTEMCCKGGCTQKAVLWDGFLLKSRDSVMAGWCSGHFVNVFNAPASGLIGVYNKNLGIK